MARSHHRPKKPHHQPHHTISAKTKRKGTTSLIILLAVFGLLIGYMAGSGNLIVMIIGLVLGAIIGWFVSVGVGNTNTKK
jgi:ABC-type nickel/cobalt efflux system permease component RcnA